MQRVRIGLIGLSVVFLLVLLTAALFHFVTNESVIKTDAAGNVVIINESNMAAPEQPKDPLAELGVAPGHNPDQPGNNMAAPAPQH
jgi:hypothetical protein